MESTNESFGYACTGTHYRFYVKPEKLEHGNQEIFVYPKVWLVLDIEP